MSFLSPTLRLENLSTQPTMTQDHVPEDQRYNKQNIVAQWCVPINGKVPAIIFQNRHLHLMEIRDNYPPIPIFIFCDFCFFAQMYRIELEHGTTSGRRMIWVNGRVSFLAPSELNGWLVALELVKYLHCEGKLNYGSYTYVIVLQQCRMIFKKVSFSW